MQKEQVCTGLSEKKELLPDSTTERSEKVCLEKSQNDIDDYIFNEDYEPSGTK